MSPQERTQLKRSWAILAAYYGRQVSDEVIAMYTEDLADLPLPEVERALLAYRRDPKNRFMPLPAAIREIVSPVPTQMSARALATESAARILAAISKFGWPNGAEAEDWIGPLGWQIVSLQGGWEELCRTVGAEVPTGVAQAQWVRLGEAILERKRSEAPHELPPLPPGQTVLLGDGT